MVVKGEPGIKPKQIYTALTTSTTIIFYLKNLLYFSRPKVRAFSELSNIFDKNF